MLNIVSERQKFSTTLSLRSVSCVCCQNFGFLRAVHTMAHTTSQQRDERWGPETKIGWLVEQGLIRCGVLNNTLRRPYVVFVGSRLWTQKVSSGCSRDASCCRQGF